MRSTEVLAVVTVTLVRGEKISSHTIHIRVVRVVPQTRTSPRSLNRLCNRKGRGRGDAVLRPDCTGCTTRGKPVPAHVPCPGGGTTLRRPDSREPARARAEGPTGPPRRTCPGPRGCAAPLRRAPLGSPARLRAATAAVASVRPRSGVATARAGLQSASEGFSCGAARAA